MAEKLKDLNITKDELNRIGNALKNEEFRKLLVEYCEEISDPANRKQYEEEISQLEKERGYEVTFIHPSPGYVIKTSIDGSKLAFINICSNDNVEKPSSKSSSKDGTLGRQWSLPHLLSPPREDLNKSGTRCSVYDVLFHPETMKLANQDSQFRNMVNNIACSAVETSFNVKVDKSNLKFPKLQYKGVAQPTVIRKKLNDVVTQTGDDPVDKLYSELYKEMDKKYKNKPQTKTNVNVDENVSPYATPNYLIKYRDDIDIQNFTNDVNCKLNAAIPKELIVEVCLPLLKSTADLLLDVTEKTLSLVSEKPSKYKLDLTLPYTVDEEAGNAKFEVDQRKLIVTLPVKRKCNLLLSDIGRYDSGVDSDSGFLGDSPSDKSLPLIQELKLQDSVDESQCSSLQSESEVYRTNDEIHNFLKSDVHYILPEYSCHLFDNILSFTLHVKNVNSDSIMKNYNESLTAVHIKFSSVSSGFFPVHYSFFVRLPQHFIDQEDVLIEAWDNNVIVQIPYKPFDQVLSTYFLGTCEQMCLEKMIEEPSIINTKNIQCMNESNDSDSKPSVDVRLNSDDELTIVVNPENAKENENSQSKTGEEEVKTGTNSVSITKNRSLSESSCDELSTSQSPSRSKGILKNRFPMSRSISESSVDDYTWSSFDNCADAAEFQIPEETEISSSMKKTVRFNDVVSKQLFKSNSSILNQRKKNRKNKNKKRNQQRRASESENSEGEEKKDKNTQVKQKPDLKKQASVEKAEQTNNKDQIDFKSDLIFDLDM